MNKYNERYILRCSRVLTEEMAAKIASGLNSDDSVVFLPEYIELVHVSNGLPIAADDTASHLFDDVASRTL